MNDILFISETDLSPDLELAKNEISHYGYSLSFPLHFSKALTYLKATTTSIVLINASAKKLEAFELCKEIKESFRGAIKVFVYLPNSNPNEASRFGLQNAEVEDEKSIKNIIDKLPEKDQRDYILEENIVSFYSMHGGCGSSFMTILLAYVLDQLDETCLIAESSNTQAIKESLNLKSRIALLSRDRSKEIDQAKDLDWFSGFISKTKLIQGLSYLNLFESSVERFEYLSQYAQHLASLATNIEGFVDDTKTSASRQERRLEFASIANSLKLLCRELEGDSYSLFDEVIQLGTKVSTNLFFDLSSDVQTPVNKQLLRLSKYIVIVFRDIINIKEEYQRQKNYFETQFALQVVPVISPSHSQFSRYDNIKIEEWTSLLGEVPLIYPYDPETVIRFVYDKETIHPKTKLYKFALDLLRMLKIKTNNRSQDFEKGLLRFLVRK